MYTSNRGAFISFEGIDGCGKSTQVKMLLDKLNKKGIECSLVREPGGSKVSEEIRRLLLKNRSEQLSSKAEALLMTASRAQLTKYKILPSIEKGIWVIADRYHDSTFAYQGGGRGINKDFLIKLNEFATYKLNPDLTFFIDISAEDALKRSHKTNLDRIESLGPKFQNKVRNSYLYLVNKFPNRIIQINGNNSIKVIHSTIWEKIINFFNV